MKDPLAHNLGEVMLTTILCLWSDANWHGISASVSLCVSLLGDISGKPSTVKLAQTYRTLPIDIVHAV